VASGILLAAILPFVYLFVFLKLDPRIRTASAITDQLDLPLLTTVPHMPVPNEKPSLFSRPTTIVATVCLVCSLYVAVFVVKQTMESAAGGALL
jgi:hypothetical protein